MVYKNWPAAPVASPGHWMWHNAFRGHKSFGYFQCPVCHNTWTSAYATKNYKQACKGCGSCNYVLPKFMWVNANRHEYVEKPDRPKKEHESSLCEACKAGRCRLIK